MTVVFEPVRLAHALWLRTQPQLFLEVDDLTRSAVEELVPRDPHKVEIAGSSPARALTDAGTIALRVPGSPLKEGTVEPLVVVSSGGERPASASVLSSGPGGASQE